MGAALDPGALPGTERLCVLVEAFQTSSRLLRERELWVSSMPPGAPNREIDTKIVGHIRAQADWALRFLGGLNLQCDSALCRLPLTED